MMFPTSRLFEMWFYSPSHSQLLVRSNKWTDRGIDTRVEVLFGGVASLCIPSSFKGLSIAIGEAKDLDHPPQADLLKYDVKLYIVRDHLNIGNANEPFTGYVTADWLQWCEDELNHFDVSSLLKDVGIASSMLGGRANH